jgi:hypothetical protein
MAQLVNDLTLDGVWDAAGRWQPTSVGAQPRLAILATVSMHLRDDATWDNEWEPSLVEGPIDGVRVASRADPVFLPQRAPITLPAARRESVVTLPPDLRQLIVHNLAEALAAAYRRRHGNPTTDVALTEPR